MASRAPVFPSVDTLIAWLRAALARLTNRPALALLVVLFGWLTFFVYVDVIGRNIGFLRAGFEYYPPVDHSIFLAFVVAIIPLIWLRINYRTASDIFVLHIYFFVFVPSAMYLTMGAPTSFDRQMGIHVSLIAAMGALELRRFLPKLDAVGLPVKRMLFDWALIGLAGAAAVYMFFSGDVSADNITFDNVYERRAEIVELQSRTLSIYVANWSSFAIAPLAMAYGVVRKNWLMVVLGFIIAVESFAVSSFRSHLFLPIFALLVTLVIKLAGPRAIGASVALVALALTLIPLGFDLLLGRDGLTTWLIHFRFIGNNGFLTAQYFYFFETARPGLYQDTFGRFFFDPVYNRTISELVGSSFSIEGNHANGNFWADGYGNAKIAGLAIASASAVAIAWLIDTLSQNKDASIGIIAAVVLGFGVSNTAVHSVLTSNGGILLLLLLFFLPAEKLKTTD